LSYLLDSNTWISLLRWQNAGVLAQLKQHPPDQILLCSVVLAELWFGAQRSDPAHRADNFKLIDELEAKYRSLPFDNGAARDYAAIRAHLFRIGQPIGPNDMLIAAIARSRGAALITHNATQFGRVPGLLVSDWQST
jgi:tRNA(fMet)-specific endonuclease VapC